MRDFVNGIGCLVAVITTVLSFAGFVFCGPLPLGAVFLIGYALYKSR
jgi:hypothetical protein